MQFDVKGRLVTAQNDIELCDVTRVYIDRRGNKRDLIPLRVEQESDVLRYLSPLRL
mgnify:CR=1 FL=1